MCILVSLVLSCRDLSKQPPVIVFKNFPPSWLPYRDGLCDPNYEPKETIP